MAKTANSTVKAGRGRPKKTTKPQQKQPTYDFSSAVEQIKGRYAANLPVVSPVLIQIVLLIRITELLEAIVNGRNGIHDGGS